MTDTWISQLQSFFDARAKDLKGTRDDFALNGYKAPHQRSYWTDPVKKGLLDDIVTKMKLSQEQHILDVGCGTGMILREIAPKVTYAIGIDFSPEMLTTARKYLPSNAALIQMSAAGLSFEDESFDRVICYHVITNFLEDAYTLSVLEELVRVTRRGGFVFIGNTPDEEMKERQRDLTEQQWTGKSNLSLLQALLLVRPFRRFVHFWKYRVLQRPHRPNLGNRFYSKEFFIQFAQRSFCEIEILPLEVKGYLYAPCRFDVRLWPMK